MKRTLSLMVLAATCTVAFTSRSHADDLPLLKLESYVTGFALPVEFVRDPSDANIQYVVERAGVIRIIDGGVVRPTPFLDITSRVSTAGSRGMMGLAFPPDYQSTGVFYIGYSNLGGDSHIARLHRNADDPFQADPDSEEVILSIEQPHHNHNESKLAFGPDGMLYVAMGDGGSAGDPWNNAQTPDVLLGKMLRLDVSTDTGYAIPPDNPFVDDDPIDAREEIWAFGLRSPWKFSFDDPARGGTGAMIIGDVGQVQWEEVDYEPAGAGGRNYGWRRKEGHVNYDLSEPPAYEPLTAPTHAYDHNEGHCIIGGYVYRGTLLGDAFQGRYFFADYTDRRVWSMGLTIDANGEATVADVVEHTQELGGADVIGGIVSFGEDASGELYIVSHEAGTISRILPAAATDLTAITVEVGTLLDGDLSDLGASDDAYVHARSGFGRMFTDLHNMTMRISANTSVQNAATLDVTIETRISHPTGTMEIRLHNWTNGEFDMLESHAINDVDQIFTVNVGDPTSYVEQGTGNIDLQLKQIVFVPQFAFLFESWMDWVKIAVN